MEEQKRKQILRDIQIKKFCLYGFLKNLKFFEPYLIIYLMSHNIDLFEIGILIAIREIIINIFEIPSGFVADFLGRKKELYFCFTFYIVAFIAFFFTNSFGIAMLGMIFYGLGEAFRSGTHKAMIYTYLDHKNWNSEKTFVYGRTRSYSLIGSAISSLVGIMLILLVPTDNYIFAFSIIPYLLDAILIISYPKFLDIEDKKLGINIKEKFIELIGSFRKNKELRNIIMEEGIAEATYSCVKDYIQPILELIIIGSGILIIEGISGEDNLKIILGLVYAVLNLFGAYFSKYTYVIQGRKSGIYCLYFIHILYAAIFALLAVFTKRYVVVGILYTFIYILHSVRKPLFVDEIDNHMEKSERATILSITAWLKSVFLIILAPILGFVADNFSISFVFIILAVIFILTTNLNVILNKK